VRCNREKGGCSYCTERNWECVFDSDRISYRPPAIACRSCHDRKLKCKVTDESEPACTKCSDLPTSCSYHPDYKIGSERDRIPYRPPTTACGSCQKKKAKCEISKKSKPVCTKCLGSPTNCSFHPAYGSGSVHVHNQDTDGLPEAEEEVQSRPTSPGEFNRRPKQTTEAEGSETSRPQPPVTEVLESQLPLITPQLGRFDHDWTRAPVSGIREKRDTIHHHKDDEEKVHPFHFHWGLE
jgi:hypothetical protein